MDITSSVQQPRLAVRRLVEEAEVEDNGSSSSMSINQLDMTQQQWAQGERSQDHARDVEMDAGNDQDLNARLMLAYPMNLNAFRNMMIQHSEGSTNKQTKNDSNQSGNINQFQALNDQLKPFEEHKSEANSRGIASAQVNIQNVCKFPSGCKLVKTYSRQLTQDNTDEKPKEQFEIGQKQNRSNKKKHEMFTWGDFEEFSDESDDNN